MNIVFVHFHSLLCAFADWIYCSDFPFLRHQGSFERHDIVLGTERISEADLHLFCAVLRALSFVDADDSNKKQIDSMLSEQLASLAALRVFARKFYKKLIQTDVKSAARWARSIIDICFAFVQLPSHTAHHRI